MPGANQRELYIIQISFPYTQLLHAPTSVPVNEQGAAYVGVGGLDSMHRKFGKDPEDLAGTEDS